MREAYAAIAQRLRSGVPFAAATLLETRHAKPALPGTSIVVDADGSFIGNIGAGCHEGELIETALAALERGEERVVEFSLDDEVLDGSVCGATLSAAVWLPSEPFLETADAIVRGEKTVRFSCAGQEIEIAPLRRLIVVGATLLASHVAAIARSCDFEVTLMDPRPPFATRERHPHAGRILVAWPQDELPRLLSSADAVVIIAHDAKIDMPAIRCALASPVPYIGVLGSRRAQRARAALLSGEGYTAEVLARIHGPAGLDLGATFNAQTACSIVAEMLAVLNARSGAPLRLGDTAIH